MSCLSFRIGCSTTTFSDDWFMTVLYHVARKGCVYAVKEVSQRSGHHIHVLVETDISKKSFSQFMKNKFPELNKGNWSVKSEPQRGEDLEAAKRYLSKGKKPVVGVFDNSDDDGSFSAGYEMRYSYPEVLMNTLGVSPHDYYHQYWDQYDENQRITVPVPRQVKTFIQRVADEIECQQQQWNYELREDRLKVYQILMRCLGEKGKGFDKVIVRRLFNGIWNILDHERFAEIYIESLMIEA